MRSICEPTVVVAIVLLNGYCLGANFVERFVNYQTWAFIPTDAFKTYHRAQQPFIQAFVVAPMAFGFLLQIWLVCRVPVGVDACILWVMVLASAIGGVSTATLQLPIHSAFNRDGYSVPLMRRLLFTDWIRKAADVARLTATAILLYQILNVR